MKKYIVPLSIIGLLFGVFGFAAWMNSILIPYFQIALELTPTQTTLVTFAFFIAYVVMALPSSWLLKKIGFKKGIAAGLLGMAVGTLLFIPAAYTRQYTLFLTALFVIGSFQSLLQTAANPYITILGPIESAASRNCVMGVCNKLAGIASQRLIGPILLLNADVIIMKLRTLSPEEKIQQLDAMILRVVNPYIVSAIVLIGISALVWIINLPEVDEEANVEESSSPHASIWMYPNLMLGALALFCAEGTESITSYYIIPYGVSEGFSTQQSQPFVDYIIYSMLAGYLAGLVLIPRYISQNRALSIFAIGGMVVSAGAFIFSGWYSVLCVILMGFFNALNWPSIWPLAIRGLGSFTKTASAILIMAIAGDAIFPVLYYSINSWIHPKAGVLLLLLLYFCIFLYGVKGFRVRHWKSTAPETI